MSDKRKNEKKHNNKGNAREIINKNEKVNSINGFPLTLGINDGKIMVKYLFFCPQKELIKFSNKFSNFLS